MKRMMCFDLSPVRLNAKDFLLLERVLRIFFTRYFVLSAFPRTWSISICPPLQVYSMPPFSVKKSKP